MRYDGGFENNILACRRVSELHTMYSMYFQRNQLSFPLPMYVVDLFIFEVASSAYFLSPAISTSVTSGQYPSHAISFSF